MWMTSKAVKLKGTSEQVRNDYIGGAEERLEARLAQKADERAMKEVEERARKEAKERAVAAEAKAKARVNAEETARIVVEETVKTFEVAMTQSESSKYDPVPMVLKTLEEHRKE